MSKLLSSIAGGGGATAFPKLPTPLKGDGFLSSVGHIIPHRGTLVDNIEHAFTFANSGTGGFVGRLKETDVWTIDATDVAAPTEGLLGAGACWYDSVNDRLYIFAVDTGTTPDTIYTAYITLETGSLTNVGNMALTTDPSSINALGDVAISRAAINSGDFTLYFADRTIVIDDADGSEVSNVASVNMSGSGYNVGSYATLDGTITVNFFDKDATGSTIIALTRGQNTVGVPCSVGNLVGNFVNQEVYITAWGDNVKLWEDNTSDGRAILRTFLREDFDVWLQLVADYGGLA